MIAIPLFVELVETAFLSAWYFNKRCQMGSINQNRALHELFDWGNISWKKTQKIYPKSDEELVKKKREQINYILSKNKAGIESGEIIVFFLDECPLLHGEETGYV